MLALPGCTVFGRAKLVAPSSAPCADLVPTAWKDGVAHTPDPAPAPPAPVVNPTTAPDWRAMYDWALGETKKWAGFGVSEAQRVEDANGRTRDSVQIIGDCERRDAAAIKKATR